MKGNFVLICLHSLSIFSSSSLSLSLSHTHLLVARTINLRSFILFSSSQVVLHQKGLFLSFCCTFEILRNPNNNTGSLCNSVKLGPYGIWHEGHEVHQFFSEDALWWALWSFMTSKWNLLSVTSEKFQIQTVYNPGHVYMATVSSCWDQGMQRHH